MVKSKMKAEMKKVNWMKVWNKIMDFFFEDVEVKEEKKQEELPEADFINKPEQPVPVKTEKPEIRSEVR